MSKSTIRNQLFLNDGAGNPLPIATGTFVTKAINIDEHRRLSLTIGVHGPTGPLGGGFTGLMLVQGTNELAKCFGSTGTPQAGAGSQPGDNGYTGARYWNTIPSGAIAIGPTLSNGNSMQVDFTDVGCAFVRVVFNYTASGPIIGVPGSGGSGIMDLFLTAKNT